MAAETVLPQDRTSAVVLAYHRIDEEEFPATNIQDEQFESHIRELTSGGYNIMALPDIVSALKNDSGLPPYTVALTFDGGHRSILDTAIPLLLKQNIPFTLFIAPDQLERENSPYMDWDDLKKLAKNKLVTIGLHPIRYERLTDQPAEEIRRQINSARARLRDMLGVETPLFAYPFGEYSSAYRDIVANARFDAAFGQQSGVVYAGSDMFALPRFSMTESYAGLSRFRMIAAALPLPVTDVEPRDPHLDNLRPNIGFTVTPELAGKIKNMSCFVSGQGKPHIQYAGNNRVELRLERDFEEERVRVNCTLPIAAPSPSEEEEEIWRWFGLLMTAPSFDRDILPSAGED